MTKKSQKALDRTVNCVKKIVDILNKNPNDVSEVKKLLENNLEILVKNNLKMKITEQDY